MTKRLSRRRSRRTTHRCAGGPGRSGWPGCRRFGRPGGLDSWFGSAGFRRWRFSHRLRFTRPLNDNLICIISPFLRMIFDDGFFPGFNLAFHSGRFGHANIMTFNIKSNYSATDFLHSSDCAGMGLIRVILRRCAFNNDAHGIVSFFLRIIRDNRFFPGCDLAGYDRCARQTNIATLDIKTDNLASHFSHTGDDARDGFLPGGRGRHCGNRRRRGRHCRNGRGRRRVRKRRRSADWRAAATGPQNFRGSGRRRRRSRHINFWCGGCC